MVKDSPFPKIDFMAVDELEQIRQSSKSKDDGPWVTWPHEMQKKSVLRRSIKWIPTTPELAAAEEADNVDYDLGITVPTVDTDRQLGTEGTKRRLAAAMKKPPEQPAKDEIDAFFAGEQEPGNTGDAVQEGVEKPGSWLCNNGHACEVPKPTKGTLFGVCPECGSKDLHKIS